MFSRPLKQETVKGFFVSTVEGYFNGGNYETMVFKDGSWTDLYTNRELLQRDALATHDKIIETIKKIKKPTVNKVKKALGEL